MPNLYLLGPHCMGEDPAMPGRWTSVDLDCLSELLVVPHCCWHLGFGVAGSVQSAGS